MNGIRRKIHYWLSWDNFFDTHQEWHAYVEGFAEGFTSIIGKAKYDPIEEQEANLVRDLRGEHHYYVSGRAFGFAILVVLITGMVIWTATSIIEAIS